MKKCRFCSQEIPREAAKCPYCGTALTAVPGAGGDDQDLIALLVEGRKIEAIKCYRQRTGLDLAEAKRYVDRLQSQMPPGLAAKRRMGCVGMLVLLAIALFAALIAARFILAQ